MTGLGGSGQEPPKSAVDEEENLAGLDVKIFFSLTKLTYNA